MLRYRSAALNTRDTPRKHKVGHKPEVDIGGGDRATASGRSLPSAIGWRLAAGVEPAAAGDAVVGGGVGGSQHQGGASQGRHRQATDGRRRAITGRAQVQDAALQVDSPTDCYSWRFNAVVASFERSYSTLSLVSAGMGDRLRAGIPL